uniref:Cdc23 domain-containing protein n=1 Tax=Hucho hucho TaxID=62062 RepID=A0A4W5KTT0_9TELE
MAAGPLEKGQVRNEALRELRVELSKKHSAGELDGFTLYLYGVVLRKLDLLKEAVDVFVEATHALPLHWGAWLELCNLITNIDMVIHTHTDNFSVPSTVVPRSTGLHYMSMNLYRILQ